MARTPRARNPADHRAIKPRLFGQLARLGRALASPQRLELLDLLAQAERPVDVLAELTGGEVANISAHLQVLHRARLVDRRRDGRRIFYRLSGPEVLGLVRGLEAAGRAQLAEVEQLVTRYFESREELDPVSPAALRRLMREDDVLVIDVRPAEEFAAGHIPGAISLPPDEVQRRLARLPRDQEIVAYCRGPLCLFSVEAAELIRKSGRRVRRLGAGFPDWQAAGFPVESLPRG